jgi:hypothetical protein
MIDSALGMIEPGKYDKDILRIFIRRVAETNIVFSLEHQRMSFIITGLPKEGRGKKRRELLDPAMRIRW